jgi:predicted 3-demethylubiquinone-9 3-methyltransferase (glyoxalase superfamily)
MNAHKITHSLWFHADEGKLQNVLRYYQTIFGKNFVPGNPFPLGTTPSGYTEMCEVQLFGHRYSFLNTAQEHHSFNDSISFNLHCDDQEEIDRYWNYFTKEGKESQCGWCQDAYGLRWQILPVNFGALMSKPNSWQVMMGQTKIVIAEY